MNTQGRQNKLQITEEIAFFQDEENDLLFYPTLLCLSGVQAGMLYHINTDQPFIIGREPEGCNIFIDSPEISREHAHIIKHADQKLYVMDSDSTNGLFVNNKKLDCHELQANDKIRFGPHSIWKFFYQDEEEYEYYQQMYSNACEDYLTGAINRRRYIELVDREISFVRRYQRRITLAIFDIDHFKNINDTYGHNAGDQVLKEFVKRIQDNIRHEDVFCRYGGEEFSLMLREVDTKQSKVMLDRLRHIIASTPFITTEGSIPVTVSIGAQTCEPDKHPNQTSQTILQQADELLYQAKREGRNRLCYS